ncbi:MAG: nuclear transport factor 2 family protein [Saprospiraceae bacterium]|nr:nuclear transport factor 2 family protein [Saprospiraceae bacterium]
MRLVLILSLLFNLSTCVSLFSQVENSKSEIEQITTTLMDYIEGTANGEPARLRKAFHPEFNLYTVTEEDSLRIRSGEKYISDIKEGTKANRIGRIISIDYEQDAAIAKVEIVIPNRRIFIDYFLLLKYEGSWKIVHKSYTGKPFPKAEEEKK